MVLVPKTQAITGCNKRCPCRLWVNCSYYNESKWNKLKTKQNSEISEWYDSSFRNDNEIPDFFSSG